MRIAILLTVPLLLGGLAHAQTTDAQRIIELEQRLELLEGAIKPSPVAEAPTASDEPVASDAATDDALSVLDSPAAPATEARTAASANPDLAVIGDFLGSVSDNRDNDALNRADIRELELDLRGAVGPWADGVAVVAIERDAENPVFPEDEPAEGPETSVSLEEVFVHLHDFGVPNLTATIGRFYLAFGRQNRLHLHNLPTIDPPLVNQAFLSPEALGDAGVRLSYVIPERYVRGQYVETIAEIISGEGAGSESPTLSGDLTVDSPAFNLRALWNTDLSDDVNVELGGSWLHGNADADNDRDVNLFGGDLTFLFPDRSGGFNSRMLQTEAIYGQVDNEDSQRQYSLGFYLLGQQQIDRDWYAGLRLDWTQNPNNDGQEAWGVSPYVSWYWNEFLRFRLQYSHKSGDVPEENNLFLQVTFLFGAHPPHPYWAMR